MRPGKGKGGRGDARDMPGVDVVPLGESDLDLGKRLTDAEGWFRSLADWRRLLRLEPAGAFKARAGSEDAGIACAIAYDRVAWIHSMIVGTRFRGRGVGRALIEACLGFAASRAVPTVKLDSVLGVEPFYERFGFRVEFPSRRFHRDGGGSPADAEPLRPTEARALAAFDRGAVRYDRSRVLDALVREFPDRAFVVRDGPRIRGYALARLGGARSFLGPCVADPDDPGVAEALVRTVLGTFPGERFRVCVPGSHPATARLFRDLGFEEVKPSTRMWRGARLEEGRWAFAASSAEKG